MSVRDKLSLGQIATIPLDPDQPSKFGTITEAVKDVFCTELTEFFNTKYARLRSDPVTGKYELPRIEKYSVAVNVNTDPLETAVKLIRSYPDVPEDLPLIAVLATTGRNSKLNIAGNYTSMTVPTAKVAGTLPGPFVLTDGMTIIVTTQPTSREDNVVTSTYLLRSFMFQNIAAATLQEVVDVINFQSLYTSAYASMATSTPTLGLMAGGKFGNNFPNKITITGGTALAALGLTIGQTDQNYGVGKHALERHHIAAELTVILQVAAESENVRTELSDLLYDFVAYVMEDRQYQFYGRSTYDESVKDEYYQIILKDSEIQISGEEELPRQGDQKDKIYINRFTVPVIAILYSDRVITNRRDQVIEPAINIELVPSDDLPPMN